MPFKSKDEKRAYDSEYYRRTQGSGGGYSVMSETPKAFRVRHPSGKVFTVAKARLGKKSLGRIGSMPKFAEGGEVPLEQSTEAVVPETLPPVTGQTVDPEAGTPYNVPGFDWSAASAAVPLGGLPGAAVAGLAGGVSDVARKAGMDAAQAYPIINDPRLIGAAKGYLHGTLKSPVMGPVGAVIGANVAGGLTKDVPPPAENPLAPTQEQMAQPEVRPWQMMQAAAMSAQPGGVAAPKLTPAPQYADRGSDLRMKAQQDVARVEGEAAAEAAKAKEAYGAWLQKNDAEFRERLASRQAQADAMRKDIAAHKIDPKRYWSDASTGQKVMAAVSVFLGGMGSRDGQNSALNLINKFVDEDIAAQKIELGKKQNQLATYLDETKDMRQAEDMLRADKYRMVGNQIETLGFRATSAKAKSAADMAAADFYTRASDIDSKNALARKANADGQAMLNFQAAQFNATQRLQASVKAASHLSTLAPNIVLDDNGKDVVANNDEARKEYEKAAISMRQLKSQIANAREIIRKDKTGVWNPLRDDKKAAVTAMEEMRMAALRASGLGANPSDREGQRIENTVPKFAELNWANLNPDTLTNQLDMLEKLATAKHFEIKRQYTKPLEFYMGQGGTAVMPATTTKKVLVKGSK